MTVTGQYDRLVVGFGVVVVDDDGDDLNDRHVAFEP